tara:strand:- start:247 stop:879 length:633 start_codon:yes stop_codon:yes gene_type:complete
MVLDRVDVNIRRIKELVVHDVIEYDFDDLLQEFIDEETSKVAAGGSIWVLTWADGVAMLVSMFGSPSQRVIEDQENGKQHFSRVMFAIKEKFEKTIQEADQTRVETGRFPRIVNLIDQSEIPLYRDLARELKQYSKWRKDVAIFEENLKKIEEEVGVFNDREYDFFKAGSRLGLTARQLADQLKEFKGLTSENPPHNKRLADQEKSSQSS